MLEIYICVRLLARNVTTSVTSNMHSLIPYHIDIQAAGLLWNNSINNSTQEQHHKTKNMFIFCVYPQLYTPQFLYHHAKSKCTTILSDLHRHFHFVFSYICVLLLISFSNTLESFSFKPPPPHPPKKKKKKGPRTSS